MCSFPINIQSISYARLLIVIHKPNINMTNCVFLISRYMFIKKTLSIVLYCTEPTQWNIYVLNKGVRRVSKTNPFHSINHKIMHDI